MNKQAAPGLFVHAYDNHDFSFTEMMQRYGMGGASAETSPQEVSQSLQSILDTDPGK